MYEFSTQFVDNGSLYSFGRADYGQLGRSHSDPRADSQPRLLEFPVPDQSAEADYDSKSVFPKVSQIACGAEHSAVVTEDGRLFMCGWNEHGNCGDGSHTNVLHFKQVSFGNLEKLLGSPLRVTGVATGGAHIFAFLKTA